MSGLWTVLCVLLPMCSVTQFLPSLIVDLFPGVSRLPP